MVLLHFYGSSHFSVKRGLPDLVLEAYKNTGDVFKEGYFPSWFIYAPGGKLFDEDLKNLYLHYNTLQNMIRTFSKKRLSNLIGNRIIIVLSLSFFSLLSHQLVDTK